MTIDTQLVYLGRSSAALTHSVNPPLVRASTTIFSNLADFKNSYDHIIFENPHYGRSGTVTTFELQTAMATLEHTESCIATGSGLSALVAVLGAHAGPDKHILIYDGVYGRTRTICEKELVPLGTSVEFFGSSDELAGKINAKTNLVYVEIPSSLTMKMVDVAAICSIAHEKGVRVACDSTWGTPYFFHPHDIGVDISLHSATKFINGHSDLMLGLITGSYENLASTRVWCDRYGSHAAPDVCWLALRGLRTLGVRMERHQKNAIAVAQWLQTHSEVKRVMFPVLPDDPGHELWKKQFSGGGGPFTFELHPCNEDAFERFMNSLTLFGIGTSWGGFESLVMPAIPHHLRGMKIQPDAGRLVRAHIGLADPADLCTDLEQALAKISTHAALSSPQPSQKIPAPERL